MGYLEFFAEFVTPVYGPLMHSAEEHVEDETFKANLKSILEKSTPKIMKELLWDSNWRASLVGAWLIFLKNDMDFIDDIGKFLLQRKGGTIGYCHAFAKFATNQCGVYLIQYLNQQLPFEKYPEEKFFPDQALYALMYIDSVNGTNHAQQFIQEGGLWHKLINTQIGTYPPLKEYEHWGNLEKSYQNFVAKQNLMNNLFSGSNDAQRPF